MSTMLIAAVMLLGMLSQEGLPTEVRVSQPYFL
jgi:hypothetical protein